MLKRTLKYAVLLILLGSLTFLYAFSSQRNLRKKVKKIKIEFDAGENHFLTHKMVNKLLIQNHQTIKNKEKSVIDLYSLENAVLKNPFVEKAKVFLTVEGTLKTIVKQREPVCRIVAKNNSYYLDKKGIKVPLSSNYSARVPLVTGVKNQQDLDTIMQLVKVILSDDFLKKEIIGIHKTDAYEYEFAVRSGNYKIAFGKMNNVATKFKKLKAFYNATFLDKTIKKYKKINVKYHNQVVCTK